MKPQSPRQPIYLSVKRKASEQPEKPEKPEPEVTFLLPRAAEPRDEDFMRNKARLPQQQPRSGATRARVCPKQNCWSAFTGWGTTGTRAKVALGWRGASWAKLSLLTSATTSCFDPKAAPSSGVHPPLQAWQGEASRCREADGQLLGAEGDHAGHESGRLRRPCCSKRTSGPRVLSTTGFRRTTAI